MIQLPPLPFAKDALSPHISAETLEYHYGKHLQGKCCNFQNGDGGRPERNWAAKSQAARSNSLSMN
jgi:Fe-Mn family superoxide dismutase